MKKLTTLLLLSLFAVASKAQSDVYDHRGDGRVINLRSQMIGSDVSIIASKSAPGSYSIYLEFAKGRHNNVQDVFKIINTSDTELIRFRYDSINGVPSFKHSYYPGAVNSKVKRDFTYRLPYADGQGKKTRITRDEDSDRHLGRVVYTFEAEDGDDIYAMRKGTVIRIEDSEWYLEGIADNKILRKANKSVLVEHFDGTVAQYHSVQEGTVTVKPGDLIFPDKIIGKAGTLSEITYKIMVSINYLTCPMKGIIPDLEKVEHRYIEPYFATDAGAMQLKENQEAICKADEDLITAEMTKREKKNRNKR